MGRVISRYAEVTVGAGKKSHPNYLHARTEALILMERVNETKRAKGVDAAWKIIFAAICDEGLYVREVSPAALVTYRLYLDIASAFLEINPDEGKVLKLASRVADDVIAHTELFSQMSADHFTLGECAMVTESMNSLRNTMQALLCA